MKIALIGYGKMGHAVERIALNRGHQIVCTIDAGQQERFNSAEFRSADVAIEFTTPATAVDNFRRCLEAGVPLVAGTTGWLDRRAEVEQMVSNAKVGMFWTSNFSIGVALFKKIISEATALLDGYDEYRPEMKEIHHIHKLDHPSGTAVSTAEAIIAASHKIQAWTEDPAEAAANPAELLINHEREGEVPGTHIVKWESPVDAITIEHRAFSREGFAFGAVRAAEWMAANRPLGLRSMPDLLGF
jgi:4-hydroxy-tetrahydrodipicolinate reductase